MYQSLLESLPNSIRKMSKKNRALNESEELLQGTIDLLSGHIAILDHQGNIIRVNKGWHRLAEQISFDGDLSVGSNFIAACRRTASGEDFQPDECEPYNVEIAQGVLDIIGGKKEVFHTEYECRVGDEQRWFIFHAAKSGAGENLRVIINYENKTSRELTEQALRESEKSYRILAETASDVIIKINSDSVILFINHASERVFGYKPEEMIGKSLMMIIPEYLRESHQIGFNRYLRTRKRTLSWEGLEVPALHRDGHIFPLEISFGEFEQAGRHFFIGVARDVSERKQTENVLLENQMMLSLSMQSSRMGAWEQDVATNVLIWSDELQEIFGLEKNSFEQTREAFYELIHEDDRQRIRAEVEQAVAERRNYIIEFRFYHADGSIRWMEGRGQAVYSEKGEPVRLYGIGIDITGRKRSEHLLIERERLAILNSELSLALARGNSLGEILQFCAEIITNYLDAAFTRVWTLNEKENMLELRASAGLYTHLDGEHSRVPVGKYKIGLIAAERKPHLTNSVIGDPRVNNQKWAKSEKMIAFAGYPLIIGDHLIGVAATFARRPLTEEALKAMESAANIIALGIERKQSEEALRESEEKFRAMADNISQFAWMADASGGIFWYNRRWYEYTGTTLEEMRGRGWQTVHHPDYVKSVTEKFKRFVASGEPWEDTFPLRSKTGEYGWFLSRALPIRDETGKIVHWFGTNTDITERKLRELNAEFLAEISEDLTRLSSAKEIMQTVGAKVRRHLNLSRCLFTEFDSTKDKASVMYVCGKKGQNKLAKDYRISDIVSKEVVALLSTGRQLAVGDTKTDERTAAAYEKFAQYEIGAFVNTPHLSEGQWKASLTAHRSEASQWSAEELELLQDVSSRVWTRIERARAQEALIKAERKAAKEYQELLSRIVPLGQTLGTARDLISVYRAIFEFVRTSMSCSAFFVSFYDSFKRQRIAAYVWGEGEEVDISLLPPMPIHESGGANSQAILNKETVITNRLWDKMKTRPHVVLRENGIDPQSSLVVPMIIKNRVVGTLEVQAHENRAFNQDQAVALEMAANLAAVAIENVRLLEVEANARREAEAANRAKDEFLSVLSHELRTPLNAMLGWTRILKSGVLSEEQNRQAVETIERNARLQNNLIEDLLDVSRIISGKMRLDREEVDIVSVVKTSVETARPLAEEKNIRLSFETALPKQEITGDPSRLQQVLINLLNNAVKFTQQDGEIAVELYRQNDKVKIKIKDTGIGISPEFLPLIFDRFKQADSTTKRAHSGLGLGLTIVRHLTELHGGRVEVSSAGENLGSTFAVELPLNSVAIPDSILSANGENPAADSNLKGAKILLVDDDSDGLQPLQILLENRQANVFCAFSAREALQKVAEENARFDILISDIGMPEMDGFELLAEARKLTKMKNYFLPAIALTAYASSQDRRRALASGYQTHLSKPVDFEQFLSAVNHLLSNSKTE